jgi:hypothetical protein
MITRAEKLIEGFKLGSLGVSRTPKVSSDVEPNAPKPDSTGFKILKKGMKKSGGNAFTGMNSFPYLYWQDRDGWHYYMDMSESLAKYTLYLWGGEDLNAEIDEKGQPTLSGRGWMIGAVNKYRSNDAYRVFDELANTIETQGIDGVLRKNLLKKFKAYGEDLAKYTAWLDAKKQQLGIK